MCRWRKLFVYLFGQKIGDEGVSHCVNVTTDTATWKLGGTKTYMSRVKHRNWSSAVPSFCLARISIHISRLNHTNITRSGTHAHSFILCVNILYRQSSYTVSFMTVFIGDDFHVHHHRHRCADDHPFMHVYIYVNIYIRPGYPFTVL